MCSGREAFDQKRDIYAKEETKTSYGSGDTASGHCSTRHLRTWSFTEKILRLDPSVVETQESKYQLRSHQRAFWRLHCCHFVVYGQTGSLPVNHFSPHNYSETKLPECEDAIHNVKYLLGRINWRLLECPIEKSRRTWEQGKEKKSVEMIKIPS